MAHGSFFELLIRNFLAVNFCRSRNINHNFCSALDLDQSYDTESSCYVSANRIRTLKRTQRDKNPKPPSTLSFHPIYTAYKTSSFTVYPTLKKNFRPSKILKSQDFWKLREFDENFFKKISSNLFLDCIITKMVDLECLL